VPAFTQFQIVPNMYMDAEMSEAGLPEFQYRFAATVGF
jgi:hypothetical protein